MIDRLKLAHLLQSILQSDPNQLFAEDAENLMYRSNTGDDLPQPGFVGPSYRPGGSCSWATIREMDIRTPKNSTISKDGTYELYAI